MNAILAGSVAGFSILALNDKNRRHTLALYLLARLAQIIDILKYSLLSETPLTYLFVRKKEFSMNSNLMSGLNFDIGEPETNAGGEIMKVKMLRNLSKQLSDEDWSWNNLNTLCWAIGSISGSMMEEQTLTYPSSSMPSQVNTKEA
ncbi:hypothetical protein RIF29_25926 [Crotalaria pallida]|uniref:Uncharacterized protein n=1 Tax=Crotalaria pallida TaxID=3830 RepID=A0AAN9EM47_CROPI